MRTLVFIITMIAWFLFVGHAKITLHPFSISVEYWWRALGIILVMMGIGILSAGEYYRGRIKGQDEAFGACLEELEKKIKEDGT